jgi:hypothetical protein
MALAMSNQICDEIFDYALSQSMLHRNSGSLIVRLMIAIIANSSICFNVAFTLIGDFNYMK